MAIRVIVLLDKGGTNTDVHHLGSLTIANDATGSRRRRNYNVTQHSASQKDGPAPKTVKRTRVENYPSEQVSIFKLVNRALVSLGHGPNLTELAGELRHMLWQTHKNADAEYHGRWYDLHQRALDLARDIERLGK